MVVHADDTLKPEVMQMWKTCFGDSDEFIEMYFRSKYSDENTLVKIVDEKAVASLQMIPYEMTFGDNRIPIVYVAGACTLPDKRKKGYMEELFSVAFCEMKKRNVLLSILVPQDNKLVDFYEKLGYTEMFDIRKNSIALPENSDIFGFHIEKAKMSDVPAVCEYCERISESRDLTVLKTLDDWEVVFKDYFLMNGKIYLTYLGNRLAGMCFTNKEDNELHIRNLLTESELAKEAILSFISFDNSVSRAVLITNEDGPETEPLGMARIIDVEKILSLYAEKYAHFNFSVNVTDKYAEWNNNTYHIISGKYIGCSEIIRPDFRMPINLLTQLLLGYRINDLPDVYRIFPIENGSMNLIL